MKAVLDFLAEHGAMLLAGTTLLLALALVLVLVHQQPIHRQRIAESSMVLCVLFLILACIPLPRFSFDKKAPTAVKVTAKYLLQPGDEAIAAEVFKAPKASGVPGSTGIGVPLPMPSTQARASLTGARAMATWDWTMILTRAYFGGVVACILYSILGHLLLHRLVAGSQAADFAADVTVRVRVSDECDRPISFGLLRPTILLPARFCELDRTKQRHILLHELAHISQRDALGNFLFNLMFPVLYFHPLYWLLRRKTNLARELIADDWAAALTSRESYVADLLALAKERFGRGAMSAQALGLFQSKTDLYRRMHMLMQTNRPLARGCSNVWRVGYSTVLVVALVAASGMFGVRRAQAQVDDAQQKLAERKLGEEQTVAAQRQDELAKLRAEQEQIKAQLNVLEAEKQQLMAELERRKVDGQQAKNGADYYKRAIVERQRMQDEARQNQETIEKFADENRKRVGEGENATKGEKQAMKDWIEKKNAGGNREQNELVGRAQLDLVSLANSYVDAIGNLQMAQLELNQLTGTLGPEHKDVVAKSPGLKIKLQIAERKVAIFRGIAKAALEAAKADLDLAMQQVKLGLAPTNAVNEPQSRLKILEVILAQ
jgi:beta-lactamase regulating signal transducer with metallopeptidase domain